MTVFTTMFESMMIKMMKKIARDYDIDLEEMKQRYLTAPGEEVEAPVVKKKKGVRTKASVLAEAEGNVLPETEKAIPLSKMKKADLIKRCNELSLDESGTVAELKARIKEFLANGPPFPEPEKEPEPEEPKKRKLPKSFGKKSPSKIEKAFTEMMSHPEGAILTCSIKGTMKYIEVDQEDNICIATIITTDQITDSFGEPKLVQVSREAFADDKGTKAILEELKKLELGFITVAFGDQEISF